MSWSDARRRMPRSAQSTILLTFTFLTVAATLGVWLVIWLLFVRPKVEFVRARTTEPTAMPVAFLSLSALIPLGDVAATRDWKTLQLESMTSFAAYLDAHADRPMILYIAAPAIDSLVPPGLEAEGDAWKGVIPFDVANSPGIGIQRLVEVCQKRTRKSKVLLVIDPGQVGSDPALGLFGSSIARRLRDQGTPPTDPLLRANWDDRWQNLGIFCACSPDQLSWPIEYLHRTAFDDALNRAFAEPGKFKKIKERVRIDVEDWVQSKLRTVQSPLFLGDPDLDFFVPGTKLAAAPETTPANREEVKKLLVKEYERRDAIATRAPYAYAPAAWRHYQERLLQAERLFRAGRLDQAEAKLRLLRQPELIPLGDSFGSVALGLRYETDVSRLETLKKIDGDLSARLASRLFQSALPEKLPRTADDKNPDKEKNREKDPEREPAVLDNLEPNPWHPYAEGQLLDWLTSYRKRVVTENPHLFAGFREDLFKSSIGLRRRVERAASAAVDPSPIRDAIEQGDRHRRIAQDMLFIGRSEATPLAEEEIKAASNQYERAEKYLAAIELLGQVQSELPFLGAYHVKRSARYGADADKLFEKIASQGRALEDALFESKNEDPHRIAQLREELGSSFEQVRSQFQEDQKDGLTASDWRVVDDLLMVPGIDAKLRADLVEHAETLNAPVILVEDSSQAEDKKSLAAEVGQAAINRNASHLARQRANEVLTSKTKSAIAEPSRVSRELPRSAADPTYRPIAAGMARLEWAIMVIGSGFRETELRTLADEIKTIADKSDQSITARASFGMHLREFRDKVRDRIQNRSANDGWVRMHALEFAHATLPDHYVSDKETNDRARARYSDLMSWMAGRMVEDFDPERARHFLKAVKSSDRELEKQVTSLEKRVDAQEARQAIKIVPPAPVSLDLVERPGDFTVAAAPEVPDGVALFLVNEPQPKARPLVWLTSEGRPVKDGLEAPIRPEKPSRLSLVANRISLGAAGAVAPETRLFYRGRSFEGGPWNLALDDLGIKFVIGVKTDKKAIEDRGHKDVADQFEGHADVGYVYPGWNHPCRFFLLCETRNPAALPADLAFDAEYGLEGKTPTLTTLAELAANQEKDIGGHEIQFDEPTLVPPAGAKAKQQVESFREQTFVVKLWRKAKKRQGPPDAEKVFKFRELNPERWIKIQVTILAPTGLREEHLAQVKVTRDRSDPIVNLISAKVECPALFRPVKEIDGQAADLRKLPGLRKDDSHTFQFVGLDRNAQTNELEFVVVIGKRFRITKKVMINGPGAAPVAPPAPPNGNPPDGD